MEYRLPPATPGTEKREIVAKNNIKEYSIFCPADYRSVFISDTLISISDLDSKGNVIKVHDGINQSDGSSGSGQVSGDDDARSVRVQTSGTESELLQDSRIERSETLGTEESVQVQEGRVHETGGRDSQPRSSEKSSGGNRSSSDDSGDDN